MRILLLIILPGLLAASALSSELYFVNVKSRADARELRETGVTGLLPTEDGYLVMADRSASDRLVRSDLDSRLLEADVEREELAIGINRDGSVSGSFRLLYDDGGLRLYRVSRDLFATTSEPTGLAPIRGRHVPIVFRDPDRVGFEALRYDIDLEAVIGQVSQDSLSAYSHYMEDNFWQRVAGTSTNYMVRNWLMNKLSSFGYDSVIAQEFQETIDGNLRNCHNVIACKVGSEYPLHQIVIGAHRDAVPGSPGGDDNGSGTSAVLEMARIIAEMETKLTVVFVLFDAEEWGLFGSYYYADRAYERGDSIVLMLNQDMIAHYQNSDEATILNGGSDAFVDLWIHLADSLSGINLVGHDGGFSGGSDHLPFGQLGYESIFVHEDIFSNVYHSPRDSTSYMNFDYMARMVQASLATVLAVDDSYVPAPVSWIDVPEGTPDMVYPDRAAEFPVSISGYAGAVPIPDSAFLVYSVNGGPVEQSQLEQLISDEYVAEIPALPCGSSIEYHLRVVDTSGLVTVGPGDGSDWMSVAATGIVDLLNDDFSQDLGWQVWGSVDDGQWERSEPINAPYLGVPVEDYDGSGWCYQTGGGYNHDVDGGATHLASPQVVIEGQDVLVQYARWYNCSLGAYPFSDSMLVMVHDGTSLYVAETVGPADEAEGGWYFRRFWLSDVTAPGPVLQLRFQASDFSDDSHIEAAVDAVRISQYTCDPLIVTESLPDWTEGVPYNALVDAVGGDGALTISDKNGDLGGTGLVLDGDGSLTGTPTVTGLISFTALATDQAAEFDERAYEFMINAALGVVTESLPDARVGQFYSATLESSGGTAPVVWTDVQDDLAGYGLGIVDNRVEGAPTLSGDVALTLRATDAADDTEERELVLHVEPSFVCGDADGNGAGPDIADLVYLVGYMFNNGPAPPVMEAVDVDSNGVAPDISDLVYLVGYMFQQGSDICPEG